MVKYEAKVVEIGPLVDEFIEAGIVVLFETGAPPELAEFSILHEHGPLKEDVVAGDIILIDNEPFQVTAVGDVANKNLANLGHLIIKTNGLPKPEMPGDVCVEAKPLPQISIGTEIRILKPDTQIA
ncbi:MAG: PTS glucitol/sorbitol transporter subunit IIA [Anaerolineae bacterium]|nr:PTS glucitol/sorbitol transporter subunit IIA [Anaerolineae bacterium]